MPSVWDHDLWQDISNVQDQQTKSVLVGIYRLILDMRESDVLAQKVADRINKRDKLVLSIGQKVFGAIVSAILTTDTILHIKSALGK